jgi:hypothetical protein
MREVGGKGRVARYFSTEPTFVATILEAIAITAASALFALAFNGVRENGIPLVQKSEYQILVPCPENTGEVDTLSPSVLDQPMDKVLLLDARQKSEFEKAHLPGAKSIPYDYLEPLTDCALREVASSGARKVVVYGDGEDPDSGEQLAKELSGKGIRNVGFIAGGAPAVLGESGGRP